MERDSLAYKLRRKMQTMAHFLLPDKLLSEMYFRLVMKKKLNLNNPQTFNEKLQWLKLYYFPFNKDVIKCTDKYAVRDYIKTKGLSDILVPLIGVWETPGNINWSDLPDKFVLKCNHGCAYNILCNDKSTFDTKSACKTLNTWLKEDFGGFNVETHYSKIKKRLIVCEEHLGECIKDYKFFCFNGKPEFLYVSTDLVHDRQAQIGYFYLDGTKMPLVRDDYKDIDSENFPEYFDEMKKIACDLAKDFPFVRVDFFLANDRFYFSELTFTPGACMNPFNPEYYDLELGKLLDISKIQQPRR